MTSLRRHHNNSSLMSKCKHLMDGTVMREIENVVCVTHGCDSKGCGDECTKKYIYLN